MNENWTKEFQQEKFVLQLFPIRMGGTLLDEMPIDGIWNEPTKRDP